MHIDMLVPKCICIIAPSYVHPGAEELIASPWVIHLTSLLWKSLDT